MTRTPAQAIADCLAGAGVRYLFGVPGGGNNLDVIGACEAGGVEFVLAHTETGSAIMASAYAELSGTVGVCVVTRGPGAASVVNGAAQATQDRQPLLVLCDTVDVASSPRIAHQNIDQRAMFAPVTKWSATVGSTAPDELMQAAVRVANSAPRGAVHVDVDPTYTAAHRPPVEPVAGGSIVDVGPFIERARRPVILLGIGAREHAAAIRKLVAGTAIPVMMTYKSKGLVPDSGLNSAGVFTGSVTDGAVLEAADLIVAIGLDSIELIPNPWPYVAPVVTLTDAPDAYHYFPSAVGVVGRLPELLEQLPAFNDDWPTGFAQGHRDRIERALIGAPATGSGLAPWQVARIVRAAAPADSVATVDAGAHMLVVMPLWHTEEPGQVLISSGLATMGYALPAAIGAALARPQVRVYCFVGDGGLAMCLAELETVARLHLPITVVVFNDSTLSLIKAKQKAEGHGGLGAVEYRSIDFAAVATGLGVPGTTVETADALSEVLARATAGPVLVDVRVAGDGYPYVIEVVRNGKRVVDR
jgi:acetolactate synthase-1/2/3 large subunit